MFKKTLAYSCALVPMLAIANSDGLIVAKNDSAKTISSAQYEYAPVEMIMDNEGTQSVEITGQYKSYVQQQGNQSGISYLHYLEDLANKLTAQGFTIAAKCLKECSTKPYRKTIDNSFRYNSIYQVSYAGAKTNRFGYLSATKGGDGKSAINPSVCTKWPP